MRLRRCPSALALTLGLVSAGWSVEAAAQALAQPPSTTQNLRDMDGDKIPNSVDVYPCDPAASANLYLPARGVPGMLLFEDQFPSNGDLDYNDVVFAYAYRLKADRAGRISAITLVVEPLALGGLHHNALGLHLPVPRAAVASVERRIGKAEPVRLEPAADRELVVHVVDDLRELFGGATDQLNSDPAMAHVKGERVTVQVELSEPIRMPLGESPFDIYIFGLGDPAWQVHRPEYAGTDAFDASLLNTEDDRSTRTLRFIDGRGMPFALHIPELVLYPLEATPITQLYPDLPTFAKSGGLKARDFYRNAVPSFAYPGSAPPKNGVQLLPAAAVDTSCLP